MRHACGVVVLFLALTLPALADPELTPQAQGLIDRLHAALSDPTEQRTRLEIYRDLEPDLAAAGKTDRQAEALRLAIGIALESEASLGYLKSAVALLGKPPSRARMLEAAGELLESAALQHATVPTTRLDLHFLGQELTALESLGITRDDIASLRLPDAMAFYDSAIEVYRAGFSEDDLRASAPAEMAKAQDQLVKFFADLAAPAPLTPDLARPLVQFAAGIQQGAWDGLDAIARPGPSAARIDASRLRVLQQRYDVLSDDRGLRNAMLRAWLGDYGDKLDGATGVFDDVLDDVSDRISPRAGMPESCQAVTCDCANIGYDIGNAYRTECVTWESDVLMQCIAHHGSLKGLYCPPTAKGPAAFPVQ